MLWLVVGGESHARAEFNYSYFEDGIKEMLQDLNALESDPNLPSVLGLLQGHMPKMLQSESQSRVQALIDRLQDKALLIDETMPDAPGLPLSWYIGRLSTQGMSLEGYVQAIEEAKRDLWDLLNLVRKMQALPVYRSPFKEPANKVIDIREWLEMNK